MRKPAPDVALPAEIVDEQAPFGEGEAMHGVSYDGTHVWCASGRKLRAFDPVRRRVAHALDVQCDAGTAFDGQYLYQIAQRRIHKLDRAGRVLATLPWEGDGDDAGLTWAEGKLWLAKHRARKILQIDPATGEVLRTLESNRFVTGVTWLADELWHGTLDAGASELRHIDPGSGEVLERVAMPAGQLVSGLESDGADLFYCGGAQSGKLRTVRRPRKR
jgi:hypothetical protein